MQKETQRKMGLKGMKMEIKLRELEWGGKSQLGTRTWEESKSGIDGDGWGMER